MFDLSLQDLDLLDADVLGCGLLGGAIEDGISGGNRDENALTDLEFYARHPERKLFQDPKIKPNEKAAIKEWLSIRDTLVRPALVKSRAGAPASSSAASLPPALPPVPGSNAAVAERAKATTTRNQIIAGALGLLALAGIGVAVATR